MRFVSIPATLALFDLLELREVPPVLRDALWEKSRAWVERGQFEEALASVEQVFQAAGAGRARVPATLAMLYKAELLRRLQRWVDALEQTQRALDSLRMQVTQVARYNEAIATYFEGLIYYILRADEKAMRTFANAQALLVESERYWSFEHHAARAEDCRQVIRWLTDLLSVQDEIPPGEVGMIVPVYEWANRILIRSGVKVVSPYEVVIPPETLKEYLPSEYIPIQIDHLPFLQLRPDVNYMAFRVLADGDFTKGSRVGDLLLVEITSPVPPLLHGDDISDVVLSTEKPFIRRTDGRIIFRPHRHASALVQGRINAGEKSADATGAALATRFEGIPLVLIRTIEEVEG